jgi:hypothetical protein
MRGSPRPPPGLLDLPPLPAATVPVPSRAFVRVEGDPPKPRRRERPAGGPPTVFGPRHRKRADGWRRIRGHR